MNSLTIDLIEEIDQLIDSNFLDEARSKISEIESHKKLDLKGSLQISLQKAQIQFLEDDYDNALKTAVSVKDLSSDFKEIQAESLLILGQVNRNFHNFDLAISQLKAGESIMSSISSTSLKIQKLHAKMLRELGYSLTFLDPIKSINYFEKSLKFWVSIEDSKEISELNLRLGTIYILLNRFELFDRHFQIALEETKNIPDLEDANDIRIKILNNLGIAYQNKGEYSIAITYFQNAYEIYLTKEKFLRYSYIPLNNIAWLYMDQGYLSETLDYLIKSLEICRKYDSRNGLHQTYAAIANVYELYGDLDLAIEILLSSMSITENNLYNHESLTYYTIGDMFMRNDDLINAEYYFTKALPGIPKERIAALYIYPTLLKLYLKKKDIDKSETYLKKIEVIANQPKHVHDEILQALYMLSKADYLQLGIRRKDISDSEGLYRQLIEKNLEYENITVDAIKGLINVLLQVYKVNHETELLAELNPLCDSLMQVADKRNSIILKIETYILKSKISLLGAKFDISGKFLLDAMKISERAKLYRYSLLVSGEFDNLLKLEEIQSNINEGMNKGESLIHIPEVVNLIQKVLNLNISKFQLEVEEPIVFIVISEGGSCIYSKQFTDNNQLEVNLFSNFITAVNMFGKEAFSSTGINDRIINEDYVILLKFIMPFTYCYVVKGPTYRAKRRLDDLSSSLALLEEFKDDQIVFRMSETTKNKFDKIVDRFIFDKKIVYPNDLSRLTESLSKVIDRSESRIIASIDNKIPNAYLIGFHEVFGSIIISKSGVHNQEISPKEMNSAMKIVAVLDFEDVSGSSYISASIPWQEPVGRFTYIAFVEQNELARGGEVLYILGFVSNRQINEPILNYGVGIEEILLSTSIKLKSILKHEDPKLLIDKDVTVGKPIQSNVETELNEMREKIFSLIKSSTQN